MTLRKDKIKNKAKVIKAYATNPALTERQAAKVTGVCKTTINNHLKDIDQNGPESKIMDRILEMDDEIMDLVNQMHIRDIKKKFLSGEEISLGEHKLLGDIANNSTKRKAIFGEKKEGDERVAFILG